LREEEMGRGGGGQGEEEKWGGGCTWGEGLGERRLGFERVNGPKHLLRPN
jgi:hypothetical protein